jgi:hypothetical protein
MMLSLRYLIEDLSKNFYVQVFCWAIGTILCLLVSSACIILLATLMEVL